MPLIIALLVFSSAFALSAAIAASTRESSQRQDLQNRADMFLVDPSERAEDHLDDERLFAQTFDNLRYSKIGQSLSEELAKHPNDWTFSQYLAMHFFGLLGGFFVGQVIFDNLPMTIIAMIIGFFVPKVLLRRQSTKIVERFKQQLPEILTLLGSGTEAGYSLSQAMKVIVEEMDAPASVEFKRVLTEIEFGLSVEQALKNLTIRIPSNDLDLVVTALITLKETGGDTAGVLNSMSAAILKRRRFQKELANLTASGRTSAMVVSLLPVGYLLLNLSTNPESVKVFFSSEGGRVLFLLAVVLEIAGYLVIKRMSSIKI